jgi:hypothetical protein
MIRRYDVTVADSLNTPAPGVYITVLDANGDEAAIYSDDGVTPLGNPFTSGLDGAFEYYAAAGAYTEEYRNTLGGQPKQVVGVQLATDRDSADVLFIQAGVGAVERTARAKMREIVSVADYGNPMVDIGDSIQKAHDALGPDGGIIWLPPVATTYTITTTAALTKPVALRGGGWRSCEIVCATSGLICISSINWIAIEGIEFSMVGAAENTAVPFKHLAAASNHDNSLIRHNRFIGGLYGVWLERANTIHIQDNVFGNYYAAGLYAQNLTSTDEGDCFLTTNVLGGGTQTTSVGALLTNAGWNIVGNKGNGTNAVVIDIHAATGNIGNFMIVGNSFEGYLTAAVRVRRSAAWVCTKVHIATTQMSSSAPTHGVYGIDLQAGAFYVSIVGGSINHSDGSEGTGIRVASGAQSVTIGGGIHIYGVLNGIVGPAGDNIGLELGDIRFGAEVTNIYSGEDGRLPTPSALPLASTKRLKLTRYRNNTSAVTWADVYKWRGQGVATVNVTGIIQGVGFTQRAFRQQFLDTTLGAVVNNEQLGTAVDVQITTSGSDNVLQVRRNAAAGGTAADVYVSLELQGWPTTVVKA